MEEEGFQKAVDLANRLRCVLVITADGEGVPHVATAVGLSRREGGRVCVSGLADAQAMRDVQTNPHVTLVVRDPASEAGAQLLAEAERVERFTAMDSLKPAVRREARLPEEHLELLVSVNEVRPLGRRADRKEDS